MKLFDLRQLREALIYSQQGGQALHLHKFGRKRFGHYQTFGHLFDQDAERLVKTARGFGVSNIVIEYTNTIKQHVDLSLWRRQ